jgi:hypothetical protein
MIFCGQCGYQLSQGDIICPRCGAKTEASLIENDPGTYNPTEISHAVLERPHAAPQRNRNSQPRIPIQPNPPEAAGPLILGSEYLNEQLANETTSMMNSQTYAPQQGYANYPPQAAGTGFYGYPPPYQGGQVAVARLLEASHRGKTAALLLILFGLLLLTGAIVILLLTLQGIIFTA